MTIRSLTMLLLLAAAQPADAVDSYEVAVSVGTPSDFIQACGSNEPIFQCAGTDTNLSRSISADGYYSFASADLATGELQASADGPDYQAFAEARWQESLVFENLAPGEVKQVGVRIEVTGTYQDGSRIDLSIFTTSGDYFGQTSGFDLLTADHSYLGNGEANPTDPISATTLSLADSCLACSDSGSGDWSTRGPTLFEGTIDVFGDTPLLDLSLRIFGTGSFDLSQTATVTLTLPPGVTFTSSSGVFLSTTPRQALVASILPISRSVAVGNPATAFATIINTDSEAATDCGIAPVSGVQADFFYQTTDAANVPTGPPNAPVDIASFDAQTYVFAFSPTVAFDPIDVKLRFDCLDTAPAPIVTGLSTLLLSASSVPIPDIVALAATVTNDGIVTLPGPIASEAFSVATVNIGASGAIDVSADTGDATLPLDIFVCETDPLTAQCLSLPAASVTTTIGANETPTFSVFVNGTESVPFDPANSRVFVRFKDSGAVTRGATSVAVRSL